MRKEAQSHVQDMETGLDSICWIGEWTPELLCLVTILLCFPAIMAPAFIA